LLDLAPKRARRLNADGTEEDVARESVQIGDQVRVRPGELALRRRQSGSKDDYRQRAVAPLQDSIENKGSPAWTF
jgi:hypothetical protein